MEESITIQEAIRRDFDCKPQDIRTYSPLTLAYIGDAIYDLVIRTWWSGATAPQTNCTGRRCLT